MKILVYIMVLLSLSCFTSCESLFVEDTSAYDYMVTVPVSGDPGFWRTKEYVDEFKQPTGDLYLYKTCNGSFSNTATKDSKLTANVFCNRNTVSFELIEYNYSNLTIFEEYPSIKITMNANGERIELGKGWFSDSTKRIVLETNVALFYKAMVENPKIQVLIEIVDYGNKSTYLFPIDTAGFEFSYHKAFIDPSIEPERAEATPEVRKMQEAIKNGEVENTPDNRLLGEFLDLIFGPAPENK